MYHFALPPGSAELLDFAKCSVKQCLSAVCLQPNPALRYFLSSGDNNNFQAYLKQQLIPKSVKLYFLHLKHQHGSERLKDMSCSQNSLKTLPVPLINMSLFEFIIIGMLFQSLDESVVSHTLRNHIKSKHNGCSSVSSENT